MRAFWELDMVPVVRGAAEYRHLFPAGTYVDAADFKSPEKLGTYLRELAADKGKYLGMLKRKDRFAYVRSKQDFSCAVCEAAHKRSPQPVYKDVTAWFSE